MSEWRPFKTAPKTGEWIVAIGHLRFGTPDTLQWKSGSWSSGYYAIEDGDDLPTHWMPLPPPPA